jgi:hypothetical protein
MPAKMKLTVPLGRKIQTDQKTVPPALLGFRISGCPQPSINAAGRAGRHLDGRDRVACVERNYRAISDIDGFAEILQIEMTDAPSGP